MGIGLAVDLQFFAEEKTEKPTPRRRQEARRKGQVAKSVELPAALILLVAFLLLLAAGKQLAYETAVLLRHGLAVDVRAPLTARTVERLLMTYALAGIKIVAPFALVALLLGVLGNAVQFGFLVTTDPLVPRWTRVNPVEGFRRILSVRALVELGKTLVKFGVILGALALVLWREVDRIAMLARMPLAQGLAYLGETSVKLGLVFSGLLVALAALDYGYQRLVYERQLRMSKQEVKDEYKRTEGDPLIKQRIRKRQREMAMRRMMQEVPKADVVITNPVHVAVALRYDAAEMDAPRVVAKGADYLALKIRQIAGQHGVTIMENPPLARALYARVEVGQTIPEDLYRAVAEVLAYVYRLKGKA
ncbi:flagellar biosynthesis protein FlhB [Calditerricola satsumensis]|uniref:Flagellar biosynthetic protein FlhB n=1 Tax=Calditerricola satsumensis TaxID=373054 RepID=A0A8J3FDX6_9BACI|nr:flagellar biosynthesis protein FlhB [Calditerricola satsumensis]GGJ97817.1 flagellar biosynthetic protein FlhB [Calditerricola satsumensis]